MKKYILLLVCALSLALPSEAVLKEKDITHTLSILRIELTNYHEELQRQNSFMKEQQERIQKQMFSIINRSNQNSLMLYSQRNGYIFDLTYACHEATEQYNEFKTNVMPFTAFISRSQVEIARYDSLVNALNSMPTQPLSDRSKIDRNVCLTLAVNILRNLRENSQQFSDYMRYYKLTENQLRNLNDYANKRYSDIQASIFRNGAESYFTILGNLKYNIREARLTAAEKYKPIHKVSSQWDSRLIVGLLGLILFWGFVSMLVNLLVFRLLLPHLVGRERLHLFYSRYLQRDNSLTLEESFTGKKVYIIMAATVITFGIILAVIRAAWQQNFIIMASELLVEYAWLLGVILISLLIRLDASQIKSGFRIYFPLVVIDFIVITFRIILIPNDLVNLIFPPVLLICGLWQWSVVRRYNDNIPRTDVLYTYISLLVFVASVICSWIGYTLLSVEVLIWWIMQLTCILTITCIHDLLRNYAERLDYASKPVTEVWFYNLIYQVVLPSLGVLSIILSIYWAADVFNLSDTTWKIFTQYIINSANFKLSIFGVCQVIILYFLFSYINQTLKALLKVHFEKTDRATAASKNVMTKNVLQVIVWGLWFIVSLAIFHINNTWLGYISVGLSTGIGFAMKDILENIYYGISLMMGRIKVGDWIEVDDKRGKVSSISYTSTQIDTIDGSIMAFQNSQLFTKNYRNLTKNHGYELAILTVGVAYGSDAAQVRQIISEAVNRLGCRDRNKEVKVVLSEFGADSINFKVIVWVPVLTQFYAKGEILESIYNALNENHIEIPFPQRDLHIIADGKPSPVAPELATGATAKKPEQAESEQKQDKE